MRFSSGLAMAPDSSASMSANARLNGRFHRSEVVLVKMHAADVEREVERIHAAEILPVTFPKSCSMVLPCEPSPGMMAFELLLEQC